MADPQWPEVIDNPHHAWKDINDQPQWYLYVPITKCASTFVRNLLPGVRFCSTRWQWIDPSNEEIDRNQVQWFVILRDPWDRWVSGATHWLSHCREWPDRIDDVIESIEMDVHTCPQWQFLKFADQDRIVYMRYQSNIGSHPWFHGKGWQLHAVPEERYNKTLRTDIRDQLRSRLNDIKISRIQEYYQKDYELIRTARFI